MPGKPENTMPVSPSAATATARTKARPMRAQGAGGGLAQLAVADQQHGVVHRHAQHRHAEAERHAVHEAEHRRRPVPPTATLSSTGTAIAASTASERNRHSSSATTSTPDAIEHSRTSDRMPARPRARTPPGRRRAAAPGRAGRRRRRRGWRRPPRPARRYPCRRAAVCSSSSARSRSGANHTPSTCARWRTRSRPAPWPATRPSGPAGRTARRAGRRRTAAAPAALEIGVQRVRGERLRRGRRGEQVAVREQGLLVRPVQRVLAVADQGEQAGACQRVGHRRADAGQVGGRRALDAGQDQAGGAAALQLAQHEAAGLGAPGGQEGGHVGADVHDAERQRRDGGGHEHGDAGQAASAFLERGFTLAA